jgi:hypothetical protein
MGFEASVQVLQSLNTTQLMHGLTFLRGRIHRWAPGWGFILRPFGFVGPGWGFILRPFGFVGPGWGFILRPFGFVGPGWGFILRPFGFVTLGNGCTIDSRPEPSTCLLIFVYFLHKIFPLRHLFL